MVTEIGTIIGYVERTGNIWFVIAAVLFGVLIREIKEHRQYSEKVNKEMVDKEIYLKSFEYATAVAEHYKEIVAMMDKLSVMVTKLTEIYIETEGGHGEELAKILTILRERLPRSYD